MIAKLLSILLFMSVMLVSCAGTDSNSDGTDANDNMLSTTDVPRIIEDSEHHSPDDSTDTKQVTTKNKDTDTSDETDANDDILSATDVPWIIEDSEHHSPDDSTDTKQVTTENEDTDTSVTDNIGQDEIHSMDFHTYSWEMIKYVGEERFNEWIERCAGKDSGIEGCTYYTNIYRFIEYFDFPEDAFENLYYGTGAFYFFDYDVDLLYETDESTVSKYYILSVDREDHEKEREKYASLGEIKLGIAEYAMMSENEKVNDFFDTYCKDKTIAEWSIADFVRATGISKEDLKAIIGDITVREYPGMTVVLDCFDFDYDALYNNPESTNHATGGASYIDKHNEDMMFCRQPQISLHSLRT